MAKAWQLYSSTPPPIKARYWVAVMPVGLFDIEHASLFPLSWDGSNWRDSDRRIPDFPTAPGSVALWSFFGEFPDKDSAKLSLAELLALAKDSQVRRG